MSQVSNLKSVGGCSLNVMVIVIVYFDQIMSHHHSDQMSQRSQVSPPQASLAVMNPNESYPRIRKIAKAKVSDLYFRAILQHDLHKQI